MCVRSPDGGWSGNMSWLIASEADTCCLFVGLVLLVLIRLVSRCPLIVAMDFGGYFLSVCRLSPGMCGK